MMKIAISFQKIISIYLTHSAKVSLMSDLDPFPKKLKYLCITGSEHACLHKNRSPIYMIFAIWKVPFSMYFLMKDFFIDSLSSQMTKPTNESFVSGWKLTGVAQKMEIIVKVTGSYPNLNAFHSIDKFIQLWSPPT